MAVEPTGLDPCDLRLQQGDAAVRELVARRVPLYRFVMANILTRHDLDRADGRLAALREAAPLVSSIRDSGLIGGYVRELAGMLGMDIEEVRQEVMRSAARRSRSDGQPDGAPTGDSGSQATRGEGATAADQRAALERRWLPEPHDRLLATERETIKLMLQAPMQFGPDFSGLDAGDFTHRAYAAVFRSMQDTRSASAGRPVEGTAWVHQVATAVPHELLTSLVASLAVEPLSWNGPATEHYVQANVAKLRLLTVMRQVGRAEVQAAADEPGREPDVVQPDVLRARRARGPAQRAACAESAGC